jgi:hypothetical protein
MVSGGPLASADGIIIVECGVTNSFAITRVHGFQKSSGRLIVGEI